MRKKTYLEELHEQYPTKPMQKHNRLAKATERFKEKKFGKMGAASSVRKIDPLTIDLSKYLEK